MKNVDTSFKKRTYGSPT